MKKSTIDVIKNFSAINQSLMFEEGKQLRTMSINKTIFAVAEIEDEIPRDFGIYNLGTFLGVLSLFEDPTIEYHDEYMIIGEGNTKVRYLYSHPSLIVHPEKDKTIPIRDVQLTMELTDGALKSLLKGTAILGSTDIVFDKSGITAISRDSANNYKVALDVDGETEETFSIKVENLKLLPGDYTVTVTPRVVQFKSEGVEYIFGVNRTE